MGALVKTLIALARVPIIQPIRYSGRPTASASRDMERLRMRIVVIVPSFGERYLSTALFADLEA